MKCSKEGNHQSVLEKGGKKVCLGKGGQKSLSWKRGAKNSVLEKGAKKYVLEKGAKKSVLENGAKKWLDITPCLSLCSVSHNLSFYSLPLTQDASQLKDSPEKNRKVRKLVEVLDPLLLLGISKLMFRALLLDCLWHSKKVALFHVFFFVQSRKCSGFGCLE